MIPQFNVNVFDVTDKTNIKLEGAPSPSINFGASPNFNRTSDRVFVLSSTRGYKMMTLSSVDAKTGKSTTITKDSFPTWVEARGFRVVNGGEDVLYVSERDGWSHIYRFTAEGVLKNQVESGAYAVSGITKVDSVAKQIYFTALGKEPGVPYYSHLYRVNFDGTGLTSLTPEEGSHQVSFVPKANYFIDTYAPAEKAPVVVLRSGETGKVVMELAQGDVALLSARRLDTTRSLHGEGARWRDRSLRRDVPAVELRSDQERTRSSTTSIRARRSAAWARGRSSAAASRVALAELGFVVDAARSPGHAAAAPRRSTTPTTATWATTACPITSRRSSSWRRATRYIDLDRVGIYGHSGGGFASTDAILRYPDFFKVAVSGAGNHDNRTYGIYWGEKYQGLLKQRHAAGTDNYDASANYGAWRRTCKGKLLLMHGDMDDNVHPAMTIQWSMR